ncbi:MAG TPA: hypothetical protein P5110_07605 [Candidatus Omnitrophota bacterium]|nr:hypothetical protein [Candidatus Omnitrophota bacterium]
MGTNAVFSFDPMVGESVSAVTATNSVELGTLRMYDGVVYRYVYNMGNSDIPPTYGVTMSLTSGYSVTISSVTALADKCFGVVVNATLTTATYGWVAVYGPAKIEASTTDSLTTGVGITLDVDGTFGSTTALIGVTAPTNIKDICGKVIGAGTATAGSCLAFVNLL